MVFFKRRTAFFFLVFILLAAALFSFKFFKPAEPAVGGFKIKLENDQGLNLQLNDSQVLTDFFADQDVKNQGFFFYTGSQRVFPEALVFKMTDQRQVWKPVLKKGTDQAVYSFNDQWDEEKKEYQLTIQVSGQTWSSGDESEMLERLEKNLFMTLIYTVKDSTGDKTLNDQDIQFLNSIYLDGQSVFSLNPGISGWVKPVLAWTVLNPDSCTTQNYTCVSGTTVCGTATYGCECSVGGDGPCSYTGEPCENGDQDGTCECDIPYCSGNQTKTCGADGCPPSCSDCA